MHNWWPCSYCSIQRHGAESLETSVSANVCIQAHWAGQKRLMTGLPKLGSIKKYSVPQKIPGFISIFQTMANCMSRNVHAPQWPRFHLPKNLCQKREGGVGGDKRSVNNPNTPAVSNTTEQRYVQDHPKQGARLYTGYLYVVDSARPSTGLY